MLPAAPRRKWLKASQADNLFWINPLFLKARACVCLLTQLEYHAHRHTHTHNARHVVYTKEWHFGKEGFCVFFFYYSLFSLHFTTLRRCGGERVVFALLPILRAESWSTILRPSSSCAPSNAATWTPKFWSEFSRNSTSHVPRRARFSHYFWNDGRKILWLPARREGQTRAMAKKPRGPVGCTRSTAHGADTKLAPVGHENLMRPEGLMKFMEYFSKG